jgi:hypothetical protein
MLTAKQRVEAVRRANDPSVFPGLSRITRLDGSVGGIVQTPHQRILVAWFVMYAWTYVVKYRQAMSSIIHISDQLRHVSYTPGSMGMIVGDKEDTYKELIRRQGVMYENLPEPIQTPLARAVSSESIAFGAPHNGLIQGITGGGENPAIGFSPDYALISEYGLFALYAAFNGAFFPAINRRPNAKCRIETTPGRYQTPAHEMFVNSLAGKGRFRALFLSWWRDMTCVSHDPPMPANFRRTPEEDAYAEKLYLFEVATIASQAYWYPYKEPFRIRDEQMWFRRISLETEFHGDPRLFDAKYPPSPFEGWLVGQSPTIPAEPVERMLLTAVDVEDGEEAFFVQDGPERGKRITLEEAATRYRGMPVVLTVDGKGYGKKGDPAAITAWNMWDWQELGSWSGDEDPGQITPRVLRWQRALDAHVIVETNKDGVAAALQQAECPKLFWSGDQPGWYSTSVSKQAALIALVAMLRAREVCLFTRQTLQQLLSWDGKTRGEENNRRKHHWDRAITVLIFAYAAQTLGLPRRPAPKTETPSAPLTANQWLDRWDAIDRKRAERDW